MSRRKAPSQLPSVAERTAALPRHPVSPAATPPASRETSFLPSRKVLAALLAAATFLIYYQVWDFGFLTVDDPAYVPQNPWVQAGLTFRGIQWSFTTTHDSNWIPLTWLSLMLDATVYGLHPCGYHLTNVVLHCANGVLLFLALAKATGSPARSVTVAALFALHPLHVESVAWVAERKDVLSTLFGMCALVSYISYAKGRRRLAYVLSFLCFVCSLLAKQTLVTFPFVLLLFDFWPLGRVDWRWLRLRPIQSGRLQTGDRKPIIRAGQWEPSPATSRSLLGLLGEKIPFFLAAGLFSAVAMIAQSRGGAVGAFHGFPLAMRFMNAIVVYVIYLEKAFYPQNLAVYYPYPHDRLTWITVSLAAGLLILISAAAIATIRRFPFLFVGWCWYLGTLVPMIGLVQIGSQQMADRYTYFPLIGIFIAVAWLLPELVPSGLLRTRVLPLTAFGLIALDSVIASSQISYWHDSVTLLRHSMECTPDNSVAHEFLGSALLAEGDTRAGVLELEAASRLAPAYAPLHYDLGVGLQRIGRLDDAAQQFQAALALDDRLVDAHVRLGSIFFDRGNLAEAKRQLTRALEIDSNDFKARGNLAFLYLKTGEFTEALAESERALAIDPRARFCDYSAAMALRGLGRLDEAIDRFRKLREQSPGDKLVREELDRTLAMKGQGH